MSGYGPKTRLRDFRKAGVTHVQILSRGWPDDCALCVETNDKIFPIDEVPALPLKGCRCPVKNCSVYIAVQAP